MPAERPFTQVFIAIFMTLSTLSTLAALAAAPVAQSCVRLLPSDGNCVYPATGLLRQWPAGGPRELWRIQLGEGKAGIVEADGHAFTLGEIEGKQYAFCLDPQTGKTLWQRLLLAKPSRHEVRGPVTTPLVEGGRIYCIPYDNLNGQVKEPRCPIYCLNVRDGSVIWKITDKLWATEGSVPLIHGDMLYYTSTGRDQVMIAVDKLTGKLLWKVADPVNTGMRQVYGAGSSLTWQVVGGVPTVIAGVFQRDHIGVHAETGQILWHWQFPTPFPSGIVSTPVAVGERLFMSGFQGRSAWGACLEMQLKDGKITPRTVYVSDKLQCNAYHTVSIHDGAVYGFGRGQEWEALQCTDFATGKLLWQKEGAEWSRQNNLTVADGLIFALNRKDELVLAEASKTGYKELGRVAPGIKMGIQQQPMIYDGRLYLRGEDTIVCYQIK